MMLNKKLIGYLLAVHIVTIAVSNYLVQFPVEIFGVVLTWASFTFPIVILATDLTVRLSNKHNARWIVSLAYVPAVIISIYLADFRIGIASGTAYLVGQLLDIFVFQKLRERNKSWWVAPAISTFFGNMIDTYSFYCIAFARGQDEFMAQNWLNIATNDLMFKTIICAVIFLPIYGIFLNFLQEKTQKIKSKKK